MADRYVPELFCSLVVHTDTKRWMVGNNIASPIPTNDRTNNIGSTVCVIDSAETGVHNVAHDHTMIPHVINVFGDIHDINTPAGTMTKPYPTLNNEEINPLMVSVIRNALVVVLVLVLNSYDMGTSATDMATRSNADMAAMHHNKTNTVIE